jgi:hypothetical protein
MKRDKGTENITGFYWKQYNLKWSQHERMLIFKWRQLRELRFSLYDVKNKHQCFLDKDWRSNVIQPFQCVDNFYGCLACGKFHICKMHANSCHIVCDEKTQLKTCRYSGRMLTIEDNLEVANWLEERRAENESSYIDQKGPILQNQKTVSLKKLSFVRPGKNSNENDLLSIFKPGNENNNTQKPPKKRKLDRNDYTEYYDLSVNSVEEEDEEQAVVGEDLTHETNISKDEAILSEKDTETIEKIKKYNKKRKLEKIDYDEAPEFNTLNSENIEPDPALSTIISTTNEIESDCELDINIESLEFDCDDESNDNEECVGGGGGGGGDYGEEMDNYSTNQRTCINYEDSSYNKNYHNNIQYNNEYYSFLNHIIKGETGAKETRNDQDKMTELLAMYAKDMREEYRMHSKFHHYNDNDEDDDQNKNKKREDSIDEFYEESSTPNPYKKNALNESITAKIQDETHNILNNLLHIKVQRKETPFSLSDTEYTKTLSILCQYYTNLIRNITLLVYQSPILDQVARERNLKNQNQTNKAFISTIDLNSLDKIQKSVDYHEHTLCPLKICRSLLLHLFVTPKALNDSAGFRILLWSRDSWLESFNNEKKNYSLITDYYNRMINSSHNPADIAITKLKQKGVEKHCRTFKDTLTATSTKIIECITYYSNDPLWLRHMIHR